MSNPTHEEINKYLTEAMGACWHEKAVRICGPLLTIHECKNCRQRWSGTLCHNKGFFTWESFGKLWEWSQKQEWWFDFDWNYFPSTIDQLDGLGEHMEIAMLRNLISPERFATAIYNFLKERE